MRGTGTGPEFGAVMTTGFGSGGRCHEELSGSPGVGNEDRTDRAEPPGPGDGEGSCIRGMGQVLCLLLPASLAKENLTSS